MKNSLLGIPVAVLILVGNAAAQPAPVDQLSALADGQRDASSTIQQLLDRAGEKGGQVTLPAGQFRLEKSVTVPTGVALLGQWQAPHHGIWDKGTTLLIHHSRGRETGPAAIELMPSSAIKGVTMIWPEQRLEDVQPYPWAIHGKGMHGTVENVTFVNAYQGIAFGPEWHELSVIRSVYGCVLRRGVLIDTCTDISRVENVHFNPHYWTRSNHPSAPKPAEGQDHPTMRIAHYMNEHLEAFIFGKTDWQYCFNTFVFGCKVGYKFIKTEKGGCNGQFLGIGADATQCAILVEESQPLAIHVTNGEFAPFWGDDPIGVYTSPKFDGCLQFNACSFWGPMSQAAVLDGPGNVSFSQCQFHHWDHTGRGKAAVEARNGKLILQACQFDLPDKLDIKLAEGLKTAIIQANLSADGLNIEQAEGLKVIMSANE